MIFGLLLDEKMFFQINCRLYMQVINNNKNSWEFHINLIFHFI